MCPHLLDLFYPILFYPILSNRIRNRLKVNTNVIESANANAIANASANAFASVARDRSANANLKRREPETAPQPPYQP